MTAKEALWILTEYVMTGTDDANGVEVHYGEATPNEFIEAMEVVISALRIKSDLEEETGKVSDGYHTFNELYHHRAVLFSVICNQMPSLSWKSRKHSDGTMYPGMFIVGINTPAGQATYHYHIDPYWDGLFKDVFEYDRAPEWDGHTAEQAIERIATLTEL